MMVLLTVAALVSKSMVGKDLQKETILVSSKPLVLLKYCTILLLDRSKEGLTGSHHDDRVGILLRFFVVV